LVLAVPPVLFGATVRTAGAQNQGNDMFSTRGDNDGARHYCHQNCSLRAFFVAILLLMPPTYSQAPPTHPATQEDEETTARLKVEIVRLHRMRAELFRKEQQWERLRTELENACRLDVKLPALEVDLAEARLDAADYNGACELLGPLARTEPHNIRLGRLLKRAEFCAGKAEAAEREPKGPTTPEQPCKPRESSPRAALNPEERSKLAASQEALAEDYGRLAEIEARHAEFDQAARSLQVVDSLATPSAKLESDLGVMLYHVERYSEAVKHLERALTLSPTHTTAKEYLGLAYSELGEYPKAVLLLEDARQSRPDDEQVLLGLAYALARSGRPDEAQHVIEDLLRIHPDSVPLHVLWGRAYASQGHFDEARQELQRALQLDPKIPEAHFYLGVLAYQLARLDDAAREFQAELANNPADVRSRYHWAITLLRQRRLDDGLALLRQVIRQRPDHAAAHYSIGKTLLEKGDVDEATRELETAIKLDADAAYEHYQLGRAYLVAGRKQEAERQFQLTQELKKKPRPSQDPIPP
jgi:tetratricopeptide (TPR) repeat protein